MKRVLWICMAILCLWSIPAMAQSAFDGTWKVDMSKAQFPKAPDVLLLQNGIWYCKSCTPPHSIKADGKPHAVVSTDPCYRFLSMKVVDERTIEGATTMNGKVTSTSRHVVSPDGNTLTVDVTDTCNAKGEPTTSHWEETRVAKGPAGAHLVSGSWRVVKADFSDNSLLMTLKVEGDTLSYSDPTGGSFTAKFGGPFVAIAGDPSHSWTAVRRLGKNTIEQTVKQGGKVVDVSRLTVAPDGKTMAVTSYDPARKESTRSVLEKQ